MNEQELRELIRRIIAERVSGPAHAPSAASAHVPLAMLDLRAHASHAVFRVPAGSEIGGPCVIEPQVACTHCGYCQSLGH
jgi:hypothetical protein